MNDVGNLTAVLVNLSVTFKGAAKNIYPFAISLYSHLLLIDLSWTLIKNVISDNPQLYSTFVKKTVKYGIFFWLIKDYSTQVERVLNTFLKVGLVAGGSVVSPDVLTDPAYIISLGLKTLWPILDSLKATNLFLFDIRIIIMAFAYLISIFAYFIVAAQAFLIYLEFYIINGLGIFFLPFALLDKTAFLTESAIRAIIGCAIKVMVLALVFSAVFPLLEKLKITTNNNLVALNESLIFMFSLLIIAYLAWKIPSLAATLSTGSPSLSGGAAAAAGMMVAQTILSGFQNLQQLISSSANSSAGSASNIMSAEHTIAAADMTGMSDSSSGIGSPTIPQEKNNAPAGGMTFENIASGIDSSGASNSFRASNSASFESGNSSFSSGNSAPLGGMTAENIVSGIDRGSSGTEGNSCVSVGGSPNVGNAPDSNSAGSGSGASAPGGTSAFAGGMTAESITSGITGNEASASLSNSSQTTAASVAAKIKDQWLGR